MPILDAALAFALTVTGRFKLTRLGSNQTDPPWRGP
jgi:hypothetical protein